MPCTQPCSPQAQCFSLEETVRRSGQWEGILAFSYRKRTLDHSPSPAGGEEGAWLGLGHMERPRAPDDGDQAGREPPLLP